MKTDYLTLTEVAKGTPARVHSSAVWRWCRRGLRARNGQKIRLPHLRIGGRIYVKSTELEGFFRALAEADAEYFDSTPPVAERSGRLDGSQARRSAELDRIDRELDEDGFR